MPTVARPLALEGLLERGDEHRAVVAALGALPERGQVIAVIGAPGIGKTAIGAMARSLAADAGVRVLRARGAELEQSFAFGVARQLFDGVVRSAEDRDELFAEAAASARAVLDPQSGAAPDSQFELLHGLFWFLVHVADRGPLVAIVDDLHWADPGSIAFVGYVARRLEELPVLLVVTSRDAEEGEHRRLVAEFAADPAVTVLRPGPLSEAAVARLIVERLGPETPPSLFGVCHQITSGNPLFLDQLLYALDGAEAKGTLNTITRIGGAAVKDMVAHRLRSLGESAVAVAQAVAVLGGRAALPVAAELAELDVDAAAASADALVRRGFFEPREELVFLHPIVRAAVYDELAPAERQRRHARAASVLLGRGAADEQVGSHVLAAPDHTGEHWLAVLLRAADGARRRASLETAAVYLRRALDEPVDAGGRVELLRMLGLCEGYSQDLVHGEAHVREALALATGAAEIGRCSLSLGRLLNVSGETVAAVEALAAGLDRLGDEEPALALTIEGELVGDARLSSSGAEVWRARLPGFRTRAVEGQFRAMATAYAAIDEAFSDASLGDAAALAERALSSVELSPNRPAFYLAIHVLLLCERFEAAHRHLTEALRLARGRGARVTDPVAYCHRALVARVRGTMADARSDVELGLEASEAPNFARRSLHATLVHCLIEDGELDQAERVLADAGLAGLIPEGTFCSDLLGARGRLRLAQGDARGALDDLVICRRRERAWGPRGVLAPQHWSADLVLAYAAAGERDAALVLSDEVVAVARELGAPGTLGVALRTAGVVRGDAELLREAAAHLEASDAKLERARGQFELGSALRDRDRLRDARALAVDCAAPVLVAQAEARLTEGGGRLPRLHASGVEALTAQERRVAELAAGELTNRQIAQELYLTEKTVETHLSNAYRKLTISSRRQLATKLASA